MNDKELQSIVEYIKKKLDHSQPELCYNIRKGNERMVSFKRGEIEAYQTMLNWVISNSSISINEHDNNLYTFLKNQNNILNNNYQDILKLLSEAQKEIKDLTDRLCTFYK